MAASARDPDWTDREAEGQPGVEDQPPGYDADTAQEGSFPPRDRPLASEDWGTTPAERRRRESLEQRVARERPDVAAGGGDGMRMVEPPADDAGLTVEAPPSGASAEEAAVHVDRRSS